MRVAEKINGLSAEVLCRYAVVYSFFDQGEYEGYLHRCLEKNPRHPQAHYMMGLTLVQQGKLDAAINEYQEASENYPKKDRFHLNETWNNLGIAYHAGRTLRKPRRFGKPPSCLLPSDRVAIRNRETEPYGAGKVARYYLAATQEVAVTLAVSMELGRPEHDEHRWLHYGEARALLSARLIAILDWAREVSGC